MTINQLQLNGEPGMTTNRAMFTYTVTVITIFFCLSVTPLYTGAALADTTTSTLAISDNQIKQNLDRFEQLVKKYAAQQGEKNKTYLTALKNDFKNNFATLISVSNEASNSLYSLANEIIGSAYYDRLFAFERLALFDPDNSWHTFATQYAPIWIGYIKEANGALAGRWSFPLGLVLYYQRTKDPEAFKALSLLIQNGHYTRDSFPDHATWAMPASAIRSREVAFGLRTQIAWYALNKSINPEHKPSNRIAILADYALQHLEQWHSSDSTWLVPHEAGELQGSDVQYVRPFMLALTVQALLEYASTFENSTDRTIKERSKKIDTAVVKALQSIWRSSWNEQKKAFAYTDRKLPTTNRDYDELGMDPQPDLNMLFAPVYFNAGKRNPNAQVAGLSFIDCSDLILQGAITGVEEWSWKNNKQFNQQLFHDTLSYLTERRKMLP